MSAKWKYAAMVLIMMSQCVNRYPSLLGNGQILPGSFCSVHDNLISGNLHFSSSKCYCFLIFFLTLNHLQILNTVFLHPLVTMLSMIYAMSSE